MKLSERAKNVATSITLKLNATANRLADEGNLIFNLTAGQLPFKPDASVVDHISKELNFLKSYQYSPVKGMSELSDKFVKYLESSRNIKFDSSYDCIICTGAKQVIYNAIGAIINPGDEVIGLAPYWVSYPEIVKLWGGEFKGVETFSMDGYIPDLDQLEESITENTKLIILNSPNNPAGIHYSNDWMEGFAEILKKYPNVFVISDEIYYELSYFDPKPTYYYQVDSELLKRTLIIDGISKSMAATGLRIGYGVGPAELIGAMTKIQSQSTSGANSLIQRSLFDFNFDTVPKLITPIKDHLRQNAETLRTIFRENDLAKCWYQSMSAFYFMLDFSRTPYMERFENKDEDHSPEICEDALHRYGLAMVPGGDFGIKNSARISLVLDDSTFHEAMSRLVRFLNDEE